MATRSRWLFGTVVLVGLVPVALLAMFCIGMNQPHVTQSDGFVNLAPEAVDVTLSRSLPKTATRIRYCRGSLGLGGRITLYRFSAPGPDLHSHAQLEFAAHPRMPPVKQTDGSPSPITRREIRLYSEGFNVDCDWMLPPANAVGTLYESSDGDFSHRPTIFIDDRNGVLYFRMTD